MVRYAATSVVARSQAACSSGAWRPTYGLCNRSASTCPSKTRVAKSSAWACIGHAHGVPVTNGGITFKLLALTSMAPVNSAR